VIVSRAKREKDRQIYRKGESILGEAEYHIRRLMPGITAGLDLLLGMGAGGGPWGPQATGLMPAALGRKLHKPSGQIPCQQCGGMVGQTQEHLLHHCSQWKYQQRELWNKVGKATGWIAGRCQRAQVSELFSMEICDLAVMDFLAAMDVGKFPPG